MAATNHRSRYADFQIGDVQLVRIIFSQFWIGLRGERINLVFTTLVIDLVDDRVLIRIVLFPVGIILGYSPT
jgi:hypothetical protein